MVMLDKAYLGYGLIVAAIWVGWEVIKLPISERAPPALAMRIAPASPNALGRAAESELRAGRNSNAEELAAESLTRAPFNVRALRVLGLVQARSGKDGSADNLLTLAGNWSLRDDPAHGWLVGRRLRQGNYKSAFAHADTLARRRPESGEAVFNLFATAAISDPRALPALAEIMSATPAWRQPFLTYLIERQDTDSALLSLGIALESSPQPLTDGELSQVYQNWFAERRVSAMLILRDRTERPSARALQNGDFTIAEDRQILPFGWRLASGRGWSAGLIEDDLDRRNFAIRADYDGYSNGVVAEQAMFLAPGNYVLDGRERVETAPDAGTLLGWRVVCLESGEVIGESRPGAAEPKGWRPFRVGFTVPSSACTVQLLNLATDPGERRQSHVVWFDDLAVRPAPSSS